jgi:site-specific recombinase XerD
MRRVPSLTAARPAGRWSERAAGSGLLAAAAEGFVILSGLTHSFVCLGGVFYVDAVALGRWDRLGSIAAAERWLTDLGLPDRMPFILLEDGAPDRVANRWLASLPAHGCRSASTWKAYALNWAEWARFVRARGSDPLSATPDDVAAFFAVQRLDPSGASVEPATWNRKVAALENFYRWAVDRGLMSASPFVYREAWARGGDGVVRAMRRNLAKERSGRRHATLRWLEQDRLAFFLSIGLGGLLPNGSEDPTFMGHHAARNRAFGELLAASGLRAQEGSLLLVHELPTADGPGDRLVALNVPGVVAKGGVARRTIVSIAALRMIASYVRLERSQASGRWSPERALEVRDATADGGLVNGRAVRWTGVDAQARVRLVESGVAMAWPLSSTGGPMTDWSDVFARATERCRTFQSDFPRVTPHTLRHTFAVHTLHRLVRQTVKRVREHAGDPALDVLAGYWRVHDPLLALRDLLGHASIATTQVYLQAIDPTRMLASVDEDCEPCRAA